MFVVALFEERYIEDYYPVEELIGIFSSTVAADARIKEIIINRKIAELKVQKINELMSVWADKNPAPPNSFNLNNKPKYDNSRSSDKAYQREHTALVHEWKDKFLYPAQKAEREYRELAREERSKIILEVNAYPTWVTKATFIKIEDSDKNTFIKKIIEVDE